MTKSQQKEYEKLQDDFLQWLLEKYPERQVPRSDMTAILTQFGYLKRLTAEFKVPAIIEKIDSFLVNNDGKLIVFGIHKKILHSIWSVYSKKNDKTNPFIVGIDGATSVAQRQQAVHHFQENPNTRLALLQMQAGGTGLTLTASHHSLFTELDFLPSTHLQCEARNRRIGSASSFVHYDYLVVKDSIEELVMDKLFKRQNTFAAVIDGNETAAGEFNLMQDLLRAHLE